jgi:hypothetical protein
MPARTVLRALVLCAFALASGCSSTPDVPQKEAPPVPAILGSLGGFNDGVWQPILTASPTRRRTPDRTGALRGVSRMGLALRAVTTRMTRTPRAERLWATVIKSIGTLDIDGLYQLGRPADPHNSENWREITLFGGRVGDRYLMDVEHGLVPLSEEPLDSSAPESAAHRPAAHLASPPAPAARERGAAEASPMPPARFGRLNGQVALRPDPAGDNSALFNGVFGLELDLGDLRYEPLQRSFEDFGQWVDLSARPTEEPTGEGAKIVDELFPDLRLESRTLAAEALRGLPHSGALLARFFKLEKLVSVRETLDGVPYTELDLVMALDRKALRAEYPALDDYVEGIADLVEGRFRITDRLGRHTFLNGAFSTLTFRVFLHATLHKGRLVPTDAQHKPLFDQAVSAFAEIGEPTFRSEITLHLAGIDLMMRGIRWEASYSAHQGFMRLDAVFNRAPAVIARGALWNIVPVWAVDMLIPSDVASLGGKFFRTFAASNQGEGAQATMLFTPGALTSRASARLEGDLEDSGFIGFAMRLFGSRFLPQPKVRAAWRGLMTQIADAIEADFQLLKAHE